MSYSIEFIVFFQLLIKIIVCSMNCSAQLKSVIISQRNKRAYYSINPYFTLIRSSFSSIGSERKRRNTTVAAP